MIFYDFHVFCTVVHPGRHLVKLKLYIVQMKATTSLMNIIIFVERERYVNLLRTLCILLRTLCMCYRATGYQHSRQAFDLVTGVLLEASYFEGPDRAFPVKASTSDSTVHSILLFTRTKHRWYNITIPSPQKVRTKTFN